MSEAPELKPCPFCGGEAKLFPPKFSNPKVVCGANFCAQGTSVAAWNRRADLHDAAIAAARAEGVREGMLKAAEIAKAGLALVEGDEHRGVHYAMVAIRAAAEAPQ